MGRQERRHRLGGAQHTIDDPRLAADLGGVPARQRRDERQREAQEDEPEQPAALLDPMLDDQPGAEPRQPKHDQAAADHDPEGR